MLARILEVAGFALEVSAPALERTGGAAGIGPHRALLEAAFDAVGSQIYVKDLDGRYVLANRQVEIESGIPHDEMIGRTDAELFPGAQVEAWRANDLAMLESRRPLEIEENITERRQLQAALESASQAKTQFRSRMSHELRTPLNAVIGFAQLLQTEHLTDAQGESVEQILKGGRHLLELINEVLDVARIETGRLTLSLEPVEVASVLRETVELMAPLARERRITLESRAAATGAPVAVDADRQRLTQVPLNLVSNAIKYDRPDGHVWIAYGPRPDGRVAIEVTDTGVAIGHEDLDRLFEPFERLGAEATATEGAGVGLALSRGLTELMGGTIEVVTERGVGSTFTVVLRRRRAPRAATPAAPEAEPEVAHVGGRQVVLYIEDNPANVRLVERIVARRPGVELFTAGSGRLGLELAHAHHPALILLDLHLPDTHGSEVLRRLRDDADTRSIPVVVVTADAAKSVRHRMLAAGARAYLTKPFDVQTLLEVLDAALADRTGASQGGHPTDSDAAGFGRPIR